MEVKITLAGLKFSHFLKFRPDNATIRRDVNSLQTGGTYKNYPFWRGLRFKEYCIKRGYVMSEHILRDIVTFTGSSLREHCICAIFDRSLETFTINRLRIKKKKHHHPFTMLIIAVPCLTTLLGVGGNGLYFRLRQKCGK